MTDLIRREIETNKLPKKVINILDKCDRLINFYNQAGSLVTEIALYEKDFKSLDEALKKEKQGIADHVYRGYGFKRIQTASRRK